MFTTITHDTIHNSKLFFFISMIYYCYSNECVKNNFQNFDYSTVNKISIEFTPTDMISEVLEKLIIVFDI